MDGGGHDGNVSVFDKRRGGKGLANGLVDYHIETPDKIKSIFEGAGISTPSYNKLKLNNQQSIDTFKNAIAKAKQSLGNDGASVELKDDYTDINLYLSEDGESGFGIKPNGDIVSVFSSKKVKGRAHHLLEMAVYEGGGRQLDCFDIYLTKIYEAHGFKPVAKMKWNDEYIPEGWNKDNFKDYNNGEPDVVFMAYDPNNDIEKKKKKAEEKYGKKNEIPYIIDYDMGEDAQHMYKWRSPAEREAIYNNMLERYKNAKSTEELKKVFSNSDKPFLRQMDDLNSLSKEQAQSINAEYSKRYLELIKDENPEEYKKNKKYLERKYNIKSDASIYIDSLIDTIAYIDAKKKEFKEEDVNRDADGKFAKKNSSSNKSNDATSGQTPKKDNDKDKKDGLDYGDLPKELHEPFKRLNTATNPSEYIINEELLEEEGMTVEDLLQDEDVFLNLSDYMDSDTNFTTSDNLQSNVESFLYDFTQNADDAKYFKWEEKWESEIHPQLKQMIKNSPIMKGKAYRAERFSKKREEIVEGGKINFDCRSVSDDNKGYEVAIEFGWASVSTKKMGVRLDKLIIFEFPENTRGLNIQGCSVYPNQHECLIDGTFIISNVEENKEFGHKVITLKKPKK